MSPFFPLAALLPLVTLATPALAEVREVTDSGFVIEIERDVGLPQDQLWAALQNPALWWSDAHTWSGSAANMRYEPRVGGCWCETVGDGEVEHGRILRIDAGQRIVMRSDLGPLSGSAVSARLSWGIDLPANPQRVRVRYEVSGRLPMPAATLAPLVDQVLAQQLDRLAALPAG